MANDPLLRTGSSFIIVGGARPGNCQSAYVAPRLDYLLVAQQLGAAILHWYASPSGIVGPRLWRIGRSLGTNSWHAQAMLRSVPAGATVYSTGETWGLPVALAAGAMRRNIKHMMYVHRVFSPRWLSALKRLGPHLKVDGWVCVTRHQADLLRAALGPDTRVTAISQGVDTQYWDPTTTNPSEEPYILSVGTEMRNYPLLFEAVRGLDVRVVVKASSAWMRGARESLGMPPPNVDLITEHLSYDELRNLYAGARLVVVPLQNTPQAAGITTIMEAMAMKKCVIATASEGLPDVMRDGSAGRVVAGETRALRQGLRELWDDACQRQRLAMAGHATVRRECSLERHAERVAGFTSHLDTQARQSVP